MKTFPELTTFCEEIQNRHGPGACVVLFGSRASGFFDEWSDYDLLVLADFPPGKSRTRGLTKSKFGLELDLFCLTPQEFELILHTAVEGRESFKRRSNQYLTKVSNPMAIGMLNDGLCITGEENFEPFHQLKSEWIHTGKIPDPELARYPHIKDGLTTHQRNVLQSLPTRQFHKSGKVVYDCLQLEASEGASLTYRLLVAMAQPFNTRYPLVEAQGNFGSLDGDPPAAMRYTECRAAPHLYFSRETAKVDVIDPARLRLASERLGELSESEETHSIESIRSLVEQSLTPDRTNDPLVFPNLLANGTIGIPNMAAKFPPFDLSNVTKALELAITEPKNSDDDLLDAIGLPTFPQGVVINPDATRQALKNGQGNISLGGTGTIVSKNLVVLDSIPYGVHTEKLIEELLTWTANEGSKLGIEDIWNLSTETLEIQFHLKQSSDPEQVLPQILDSPPMKNDITINLAVLENDQIVQITLPEVIRRWANQRFVANGENADQTISEFRRLSAFLSRS